MLNIHLFPLLPETSQEGSLGSDHGCIKAIGFNLHVHGWERVSASTMVSPKSTSTPTQKLFGWREIVISAIQ